MYIAKHPSGCFDTFQHTLVCIKKMKILTDIIITDPKASLEKIIRSYIDCTPKEYLTIRSYFKTKTLKRLEILHDFNDVCNNYYFIESGVIRYYQMKDGEEVTGGFFFEGSGYTDLDSFLSNTYSKQTAQAIECSSLLFITKLDLEKLYQEAPKFERITRLLVEEAFIDLRKKVDNLILLGAKERYLNLLKNKPELTRRIPQYYIASYLGIKPQSLSRIRKNLSSNFS